MSLAPYLFKGGIHPPDSKKLSGEKGITPAKVPALLTIPLVQHIGAPCKAAVEIGQIVKKGECIGNAGGFVYAPVHASVSGKVTAFCEVQHPAGKMVPAITIENDNLETWAACVETPDYASLTTEQIVERILAAGIVGMGGATFPTHVKLSPPKGKTIDTVIINGVECEPYLTADYRLMLEKADEIIAGTRIIMKALGVSKGFIGIEANKPKAVEVMKKALSGDASLSVVTLHVKYPQGAEKMLIKAIVDREVPPRALPLDVGVVVQNVATAVAVYDAVRYGRPLIERVVTVTGDAIKEPKNLLVRIGTSVADLISRVRRLHRRPGKSDHGRAHDGICAAFCQYPGHQGNFGYHRVVGKELGLGR